MARFSFGNWIGKPVLVSIPALFDDGKVRSFTLVGVEIHGLWLQSDELTRRLLSKDLSGYADMAPVIFVPFAQIAGVLVPTQAPTGAPPPAAAVVHHETKSAAPAKRPPKILGRKRGG